MRAVIVSFCFASPVAAGLGGDLPHWVQDSVQSNVSDTHQQDVKAYLAASSQAGLPASAQRTSTLRWPGASS